MGKGFVGVKPSFLRVFWPRGLIYFANAELRGNGIGKQLEIFTFSCGVSERIFSQTWMKAAAVCRASGASHLQNSSHVIQSLLVWLA